MAVYSVTITNCKKFDFEGKLGFDDGNILVDFLLLACGACLGFGHKMYLVCFVQGL